MSASVVAQHTLPHYVAGVGLLLGLVGAAWRRYDDEGGSEQ